MSNKNILHSFNKLISPNIEYELHIGRYDPNTYRYLSLISKESFNKILSLIILFDPKKTEYSINKVENCFDRDVRAVTTYYEGNKVTEFNKSVFANKEPTFEKKKTIHSFFLEGSAIKISLATEDPTSSSKIKKGKYRLKRRISKYSKDGLWRFDFTYVYFDLHSDVPNIKNKDPSYSLEIEYIHPSNKTKPDPKKYFKSLKELLPHVIENVPEVHQPLNMRIINKVLKKFNQDYKNPRDRLQNQDITTVNMNGGLMNQVIPLEQKTFHCILQNHAVTEKADGERYFIYIDDDGTCYRIAKSKEVIKLNIKHKMKNALLDCEYIPSLKKYMVLDILIHNNNDISSKKLEERIKVISKYNLKTKKISIQEIKQYIPDDKNTIFNLSKQVFTKNIHTNLMVSYINRLIKDILAASINGNHKK